MRILNGITLTGSAVLDSNSLIVGTTQLVVSSGKIGIGTSTPSTELHIVDSNPELLRLERTGGLGNAVIGASSLGGMVFFGKPQTGNFAVGATFDLTSSPYFTVGSNGNFGIGTGSTPSFKLHVSHGTGGDSTFTGGILVENTSATTGEPTLAFKSISTGANYWLTGLNEGSAYSIAYGTGFLATTTKFTINTAGNVGISTTNPAAKLDVVGEIRTSDKFGYGASAYTQYNATSKSIDFIFV